MEKGAAEAGLWYTVACGLVTAMIGFSPSCRRQLAPASILTKLACHQMERLKNADIRPLVLCLVPIVVSATLTALLYVPSLDYGFMYDAPFDLPWASDRDYLEIFTRAGELQSPC